MDLKNKAVNLLPEMKICRTSLEFRRPNLEDSFRDQSDHFNFVRFKVQIYRVFDMKNKKIKNFEFK